MIERDWAFYIINNMTLLNEMKLGITWIDLEMRSLPWVGLVGCGSNNNTASEA